MKTGLIGYGQMGRNIEQVAVEHGHEIVFRIDFDNHSDMTPELLKTADVVIEFTRPEAAFENVKAVLMAGVPVVCGTTGWTNRFEEARDLCRQYDGGLLHSSNFSLGVNLFFELNKQLGRLMNHQAGYKARIEEIHHTRKVDSPSGTAMVLAGQLAGQVEGIKGWSADLIPGNDQVQITSIREGQVTGIHEVIFYSGEDRISIRHEAFNRLGFAKGAILAAEFMVNRKGVYSMSDLFTNF